ERRTAFESPDAATQPIERTRTHWIARAVDGAGSGRFLPYAKQTTRWLADPVSRVVHTTVTEVAGSAPSVAGDGCASTLTSFTDDGLDAWGNPLTTTTTTVDAYATKVEQVTHSYQPADAGNWWVNKLASTQRTAAIAWQSGQGPVPGGDLTQSVSTTYGFTAQRALNWQEETTGTALRRTDYAHDVYGNVIRQALYGTGIEQAQSRRVLTGYDAGGYFPTSTTA